MRTRPLLVMIAASLVSCFLLVYPVYVIRPFRHQGARELATALIITQYRTLVEAVCAVVVLFVLLAAWNRQTLRRKWVLALVSALVIASGFLTQINIYEKMFHPLDSPTFSAASQSKLNATEQVIAVRVNSVARAYPIRDISYHHIVNDTLGGRAIVATY